MATEKTSLHVDLLLFARDDSPEESIWERFTGMFADVKDSFTHTFTPALQEASKSFTVETVRGQHITGGVIDEVPPLLVSPAVYRKLKERIEAGDIAMYDFSEPVAPPVPPKRKYKICHKHGKEMKGGFCRQCQRTR